MAGLKEFYCRSNETSLGSQFKWLEYTFKTLAVLPAVLPVSFCHAACLSACHPVRPTIGLSGFLSVCLLSVWLPVRLSIGLSGFLSVCRLPLSFCSCPSYLLCLLLSSLPLRQPAILSVLLSCRLFVSCHPVHPPIGLSVILPVFRLPIFLLTVLSVAFLPTCIST
jgi:hypothetical protein